MAYGPSSILGLNAWQEKNERRSYFNQGNTAKVNMLIFLWQDIKNTDF
jgi:hypothetical protein